jgi:hypothetical protein
MPKDDRLNILSLDAADINGNGIPEIFASSYANKLLNSFALEHRDGKFVKVWENADVFLRCLPTGPEGSYQLYGQGLLLSSRPWGKIHQYVWSKNTYQKGPVLEVPAQVNLYGLALMDLDKDGKKEILTLSGTESRQIGMTKPIMIYGPEGKKPRKTSEEYGGTYNLVEVPISVVPPANPTSEFNRPESQEPVSLPLQPRLFPVPGKLELYVCQNIEAVYSVTRTTRFFEKSKIWRLAWDGDTLAKVWESKEFPEYLADYYLGDFDGDGVQEIAVLLVQENFLSTDTSSIWIYKL